VSAADGMSAVDNRTLNREAATSAAGSRQSRRRGRPTNERRRTPAGLSPCDAALAILRAIVARLRRPREERPIFKRIDVDDAPYPIPICQSHCDIDAAPSADDLLRRSQTERVSLKLIGIVRGQRHIRLGIGKRPRVVLAAEGALADAERLLGWRPVGYELDANRAAMTPALEDQARYDCFRRALHTRLNAAR
jgi:hypothetical protein